MPASLSISPKLEPLRPDWIEAASPDPAAVARLERELRLPATICRLLAIRGISEPPLAKSFLRPSRDQIHPPMLLADMDAAVERLAGAIRSGESILIHGDYDVDGICATALLVRAIRMMGGSVTPFVPHRLHHGYDFTTAGIEAAGRAGATLIVTVDCGIVAHGPIAEARDAGIDVIVTDHHTPSGSLPEAVAVVNPNRPDCSYPERSLAGAGVAFKLAVAVAEALGVDPARISALIDLVAVATIADLAPLTRENRAIVRWGLSVLQRTPNPGMRALLRSSGLAGKDEITAGRVGYVLAPRLNAAGRLGDAMRGVRLLLTDDEREADRLALELEKENRRRQDLDEKTLADALRMLERSYDPERDHGVVLASPDWHPGVIGIVASRIVERINRPTVLIALDSEEGKGSARSIRGFHLYNAIAACASHLIRFGGHRAAAGCSLRPENVEPFRVAFNDAASAELEGRDPVPELRIDTRITLDDATLDLTRMLRHLGPFGIGNPSPVFAVYGARIAGSPRIVGGKHLKLDLAADGATLPAIGFGLGDRLEALRRGPGIVDVAFKLEENRWTGGRGRGGTPHVQAQLLDVRSPG